MKKVIRANAKSLSKNFYRVTPQSAKKEFQDALNGGDSPEPEPPVTTGYTFESITLPDDGDAIFYPEGYEAGQTILAEDIQAYTTAVAELAAETMSEKDAEDLYVECSGTLPTGECHIYASKADTFFTINARIYPEI